MLVWVLKLCVVVVLLVWVVLWVMVFFSLLSRVLRFMGISVVVLMVVMLVGFVY